MNDYFMPSLGHMALIVIAVSLWNDVINLIFCHYLENGFYHEDEEWQQIEDKVSPKISHLSLPSNLQVNLMGCIKPIGLQFLKWIHLCSELGIKIERYLVNDLCWTSNGTVDVKETTKCLIKNETLGICKRYELACVFCLEKDIPELWNKIPIVRSKGYYSKYVRVLFPNKLALIWAYDMKGEISRLARPIANNWRNYGNGENNVSPYQFAFEYSGCRRNLVGVEYFLQKLTLDERKECLVRVAKHAVFYPKHSGVFYFLLSQMDEEQLMQVYQSFPDFALVSFLEFPYQNSFMKLAKNMMNFISPCGYDYVLQKIVEKITDGYIDYDYQALFGNFWQESTAAQKRFVMDKCVYGHLLKNLSRIKDVKITALLLRHAIAEVQNGIFVPQRNGSHFFH